MPDKSRASVDQADDVELRFQSLVQSPLRAGLLRFLSTHRDRAFDVADLMQSFGRMRLDIENCLVELVNFGVASRHESGAAPTYEFREPPALPTRELVDEFLRRQAPVTYEDRSPAVRRFRELIGTDDKMFVVFEWIRTAAKSDIAVLILGATGSGKELVARMIHELSRRSTHRFQTVNCAALPESLFESELFGHEKGAFTGAQERKIGRFELAHKGTLFLDEIGDLAVVSQAKLLRALEERRIERLGSSEPIDVDFRLVSSTNRPLDLLVREEQFREDLYYRINAFAIRLPSLRERVADIPILATRALARHCEASQLAPDAKVLSKEALDMLARYHWPGNIRELESTLSRAAMSTTGRVIRPADLELLHAPDSLPTPAGGELQSLALAERAHIVRVLEAVRWNKKHAAQVLEISRGTLYRKILEYGLESRVRH
jgi:transcriptional regulator with PAS, ATPase and Fis domain